jgi:RHS repeat-associated protein
VTSSDYGGVIYDVRSSVLGGQVVAEIRNGGGSWIWSRGYVYWPGGELLAVQQGVVRWVHRDPVVKSARVVDVSGQVESVVELDPWGGETERSENPRYHPYVYGGYERDGNWSDQAQRRVYHGWYSRFYQPDPWDGSYDLTDPQSFNRYTYVQNDPVNFTDPSGLDRFCIIDVSYRHFEYINKDGDQTIRIETILHQTCFDMPTAPIGGGEIGGGGVAPVSVPTQSPTPAPITSNQPQHSSKSDAERLAKALAECTTEHFGLNSLLGLMGLRLGQPTRPKVGAMGSIPGTSRASELSRGIFGNAKLPFKLPAPTFSSLRTLTITSARVGTVVGRAVPVVGAAMVTYDAVSIGNCVKRRLKE